MYQLSFHPAFQLLNLFQPLFAKVNRNGIVLDSIPTPDFLF